MSLPETQRRNQYRRQSAAEIKQRRECQHEWELLWGHKDPKHRPARRAAWKRYCAKCGSYAR